MDTSKTRSTLGGNIGRRLFRGWATHLPGKTEEQMIGRNLCRRNRGVIVGPLSPFSSQSARPFLNWVLVIILLDYSRYLWGPHISIDISFMGWEASRGRQWWVSDCFLRSLGCSIQGTWSPSHLNPVRTGDGRRLRPTVIWFIRCWYIYYENFALYSVSHSFVRLFFHSFVRAFIHSFRRSINLSFIHLFVNSFIHSGRQTGSRSIIVSLFIYFFNN